MTRKQLPSRSIMLLAVSLSTACSHTATNGGAGVPRTTAVADTSPERARALLTESLRALGASARLRGFEIELETRQGRGNPNQARNAADTMPFPVPGTLRYVVDLTERRVLFELRSPAPGNIWFNYLTGYDSAGGWQVDLLRWRLGNDIVRASAVAAKAAIASAERLLPSTLVKQALDDVTTLRYLGIRSVGDRQLHTIEFRDPGSAQTLRLELDAATMFPAYLVTTVNPAITEFRDYRKAGGLQIPYERVQRAGDVVLSIHRATRLNTRPDLGDARFAIPPGYADAPPATGPSVTKVAGGLYRLDNMPTGYHAAFVVGTDGIVVLEAPQSNAFTEAALRLIAATAPQLPITHVFVTHHHGDHVGGLAPYVARGATVVVGAGLEEAIRRQLPDSLRSRVKFETVTGQRTFGSGTSRIEALSIPNEHANGNVAYYVPDARALFQGDLFYIPERGDVPPAFPVTNALVAAMRAAGITPEHVIGVHGRTGNWREVELSVQRGRARR